MRDLYDLRQTFHSIITDDHYILVDYCHIMYSQHNFTIIFSATWNCHYVAVIVNNTVYGHQTLLANCCSTWKKRVILTYHQTIHNGCNIIERRTIGRLQWQTFHLPTPPPLRKTNCVFMLLSIFLTMYQKTLLPSLHYMRKPPGPGLPQQNGIGIR